MQKLLLLGVFASLLTTVSMAADKPVPVLDLPLNNETALVDQSASKLEGTAIGKATVVDNSLLIKGKRSYLNLGPNSVTDIGKGGFTIIITFKLTGRQDSRSALVSKGAGDGKDVGYAFMYRLPKKSFFFYVSDGKKRYGFQSKSNDLNDEQWHTAAVTLDRDNEVIFVLDGKMRGARDASGISEGDLVNPDRALLIGSWVKSFSLHGNIKNVKIYKKSLTDAQLISMTKQK